MDLFSLDTLFASLHTGTYSTTERLLNTTFVMVHTIWTNSKLIYDGFIFLDTLLASLYTGTYSTTSQHLNTTFVMMHMKWTKAGQGGACDTEPTASL
jgi:hypothetical protein